VVIALMTTLAVAARAQAASPLRIAKVAVDAGQVTITGSGFGSTPSVTLGGAPLGVVNSSESEIVAQLTAQQPGVYELTVKRGGSAPEDTASTVVIIQ
jgi:hypothetical protein